MKVEDLHMAKAEPISAVTDRNPDVECEFFHTRQVHSLPPLKLMQALSKVTINGLAMPLSADTALLCFATLSVDTISRACYGAYAEGLLIKVLCPCWCQQAAIILGFGMCQQCGCCRAFVDGE